jgi:hypothetical protein
MNDRLFRVVIPDPELLGTLKKLLEDFAHDSDALLGFQMTEGGGGLWTLVSGSGEVLARSRSKHMVFGSLLNFIDEMAAPAPTDGVVRLAMRALVRTEGNGATLFGPHPHLFGPFIERRLEKAGLSVVDSRFVDIDMADGPPKLAMTVETPAIHHKSHLHVNTLHAPIERIALPAELWRSVDPTPGVVAAAIASSSRSAGRKARLAAANAVVGGVRSVERLDTEALHEPW